MLHLFHVHFLSNKLNNVLEVQDTILILFCFLHFHIHFLLNVLHITLQSKNYNICFMCSEKYFYECHRGVMLSEFFYRKEHINIIHLIDSNTKYLHNTIEKNAKLYFEELKNKFVLKNSQYLLYGEGLITNSSLNNSNIDYWKEFFEEYSYDKGYWLLNLKIGYKKGEDENE